MAFSGLSNGADNAIQPFTIKTPEEVLGELQMLVQGSRIAVPTFKNSLKDSKYGVDREWMQNIKEKWTNFDW
jgi:Epoxide hydrolase N terminus